MFVMMFVGTNCGPERGRSLDKKIMEGFN